MAYVQEKGIEPDIRLYLKDKLNAEEIKRILMKLNIPPSELVRTQEEQYKKELKGKNFTEDEWISIYVENPKLIKRPIVETDYKAVIGIPLEEIDGVL